MKKECYEFQTLITSYIDNELEVAQKNKVELHLEKCPDCQKSYSEELKVKKLIKERTSIFAAPAYLRDRIRHQLVRGSSKPGFGELVQSLFTYRPLPASLALAVIMFLVLFPTYRMIDSGAVQLDGRSAAFDISEPGELRGEIICLDCEFLSKTGHAFTHDSMTHRPALKTADNIVWTFLHTDDNQEVLHNHKFLHKKAVVTGILFKKAHYVEVQEYKLL